MKENESANNILNDAYEQFKANPGAETYPILLQALEDTLRDDGCVWVPTKADKLQEFLENGSFQWCAVQHPSGCMLAVYTYGEQIEKRKCENEVGVVIKLVACFDTALRNDACNGFIVNPHDDLGGVIVNKDVVALIRNKAAEPKGLPDISFDLISAALFTLWGNAVNAPVLAMTAIDEANDVGGIDRVVGPVIERWNNYLAENKNKDLSVKWFLDRVFTDAYNASVAAGAMVHLDKNTFSDVTPDAWVQNWEHEEFEDIEDVLIEKLGFKDGKFSDYNVWEETRRKNVARYFEILEAKIGLQFKCESVEMVHDIMVANLGMVVTGICIFGLGYGAALYAESCGPEAVACMQELQKRYLTEGYEAVKSSENGRDD